MASSNSSRAKTVTRPTNRRRVLLAMEWFDYEINLGIAEYARKAGWIVDDAVTHTGQPPQDWTGDGIIALLRLRKSELVHFVTDHQKTTPIVDLVGELPEIEVPRVLSDDRAIGRVAAEHLLSCGLHHFAFFNLWDSHVEMERMAGFREEIERAGRTFHALEYHGLKRKNQDLTSILSWLQEEIPKLPRPIGMMGQCDREAMYIIQACDFAGLRMPEEVAVVGSDNDPMLCELGLVPLSSVDNRRRDQGYKAAEILDQLMDGQPAPTKPIHVPVGPVIVRYSSEVLAVPDPDLSSALRFIADHYREPISVDEVVEHADTTRRHLYMLFEKHLGRPIHAEILRRKLDLARRLLLTTDDKLYAIGRACGFQSGQQLTRVFTREIGISPSQYRKRGGQ